MKLLILGGTTEGRQLAERLSGAGHQVTVSVATDYGAELLDGLNVFVHIGRLNAEEMTDFFRNYDHIIDATHPYAVEVSRNARAAAACIGVPYDRLVRAEGAQEDWWQRVDTMDAAVHYLSRNPGRVLLTTGSKDLRVFSQLDGYQERLWVRILASHESLELALQAGIPSSHIIAMQGPFSAQLNEALLRQFGIDILVTKRSGRAGGFEEKAQAVRAVGGTLLVVERPQEEQGLELDEMVRKFS